MCNAACENKDDCKAWTYYRKPVKENKDDIGYNCVLRKERGNSVKHFDNAYVSGEKGGNIFSYAP